ncbi:MFS transporter [Mycoplasma sp. E35C]|uniref:MFS transporter n=1 Tax=Mycoplasma sp. E35C TaxID=2801918 RepID=UPI001CA3C111|nr:MFS transporter [Mycoplasma sp. E35C]QZX49102.1 MFS transporter [Mycoplasma sp. E35C]
MAKQTTINSDKKSIWIKLKEFGWKKTFALFILGAIDVLVIAAPYYIKNFVPNIQLYLGVEEKHISYMTSIVGAVTLVTQLPGGYLADKISSKKLLFIGGILTALMTIWYGSLVFINSNTKLEINQLLPQYYTIFAIYGLSSTPFFWTPLWKLVSQQADKKDQGFAYGLQGSLNGLFGFIFVFLGGIAITAVAEKFPIKAMQTSSEVVSHISATAFGSYIIAFAVLLILASFGVLFYVKEYETHEKFALSPRKLFTALTEWKIWALAFFVMGMYMFQSVLAYYLFQMITNVTTISTIVISVIAGIRLYGMRFLVSTLIGKFSDKLKSLILFLLIMLVVGIITSIVIILLPGISLSARTNLFDTMSDGYKLTATILMVLLFLLTSVFAWIMVTLRFVIINEVVVPKKSSGAAIATLSFIGFSSDAWFYAIAGAVQNKYTITNADNISYTSQTGYQIIAIMAIVTALVGLVAGIAVYISNYKFLSKYNIRYMRVRAEK